MANCKRCGREMPSFSFGDLQGECKDCRQPSAVAVANSAPDAPTDATVATVPRVSLRSLTPVTSVIIGINVAVLLGMAVTGGVKALSQPPNELLLTWGADWGPLTLANQPWRAFTSMWVHAGLIHLFMNMWCMDVYGRVAERVFGWRTYLAVYVLTGLSGSLASLGWHPTIVSVGASAAVFGVVGSLVLPYKSGRLPMPPDVLKRASKSLITFAGYNLLIGMVVPAIDNSAHVGGLLGGLALGALWSHGTRPGNRSYMMRVAATAALVLVSGFFAVRQFRQWDVLPLQAALDSYAGRNDEAIAKAKTAIGHKSKDALAYMVLGDAFIAKSQPQEAADAFEKATRLDPKYEYGLARLGMAYTQLDRYADAIPVLERAVKLDQDDTEAWTDLGLSYWQTGRKDDAVGALQTALKKDPKLARGQFALGMVREERGEDDLALTALGESVKLDPKNAEYAKQLAELYDKKGLHDEAEKVRRAVAR